MIKLTEYESHAAECRQMARQARTREQKLQLEEMAQAWDALARDRATQIAVAARLASINPYTDTETVN
jgi:hypothetical protein